MLVVLNQNSPIALSSQQAAPVVDILKNQTPSCRLGTSHVHHRVFPRFLFSSPCLTLNLVTEFATDTVQDLPVWCNYLRAAWHVFHQKWTWGGSSGEENRVASGTDQQCSAVLPEEARTSCSDSSWSRPRPLDTKHLSPEELRTVTWTKMAVS